MQDNKLQNVNTTTSFTSIEGDDLATVSGGCHHGHHCHCDNNTNVINNYYAPPQAPPPAGPAASVEVSTGVAF